MGYVTVTFEPVSDAHALEGVSDKDKLKYRSIEYLLYYMVVKRIFNIERKVKVNCCMTDLLYLCTWVIGIATHTMLLPGSATLDNPCSYK